MRSKIEEVGIHFSKRRTYRQKYLFLNRLIGQLKGTGCETDMIEKQSKTGRSNHLVIGDLKKKKVIIAAAYDTGSKMLNPFYTYTPLDSRHNYKEEMRNAAAYSILTIGLVALAVFFTRWGFQGAIFHKTTAVLFDLIAVLLVFRWMKRPDNKFNINRNSGAIAVMYESIEKTGKGCYVFLDNSVMSNQGYYEFSEAVQDQQVIVLDCIARGEEMFLAYQAGMEKMAQKIADAFEMSIHLLPLNEKQYANTPMAGLKSGFMLTSGRLSGGVVCVKQVRNSSDVNIDLDQLEKVEKGIEALFL